MQERFSVRCVSRIFMSRIFHPLQLCTGRIFVSHIFYLSSFVPHFLVAYFPPLQSCAVFSYAAFSCPAFSASPFDTQKTVVRRLTIDIACKHTKFDDASFSCSEDTGISGGVKPRSLRRQLVTWRLALLVAKQCTKFEVCSFCHSEDISWGVKF